MSTNDRPGSGPEVSASGPEHGGPDDDYTAADLAQLDREQLNRLGARHDGVEILHVDPPPARGSGLEKQAERQVTWSFVIATLFALAFIVVYFGSAWFLPDWQWTSADNGWSAFYTPLLGLTMAGSLVFVGLGLVLFVKKLLPHETAVQDKHDGSQFDRTTTAATLMGGLDRTGFPRRKMIGRTLGLAGATLGLIVIAPLGGFIKNPNKGNPLGTTPWANGVRLLRDDGTPIRPGDQQPGSLETVFPAVAGGNRAPDAATMLIRLRPEQVANLDPRNGQGDFRYGDYIAFSKICTHAGCPVSLYEQQTGRILCPCHQSQFDVTQGAKPVFGPASRPLPELPITLDDEGYFIAQSDYIEAVGPTYWNRERI